MSSGSYRQKSSQESAGLCLGGTYTEDCNILGSVFEPSINFICIPLGPVQTLTFLRTDLDRQLARAKKKGIRASAQRTPYQLAGAMESEVCLTGAAAIF